MELQLLSDPNLSAEDTWRERGDALVLFTNPDNMGVSFLSAALPTMSWSLVGPFWAINISDAHAIFGQCLNLGVAPITANSGGLWSISDINPAVCYGRWWPLVYKKLVDGDFEPTSPWAFGERLRNIVTDKERFSDDERKLLVVTDSDFMSMPPLCRVAARPVQLVTGPGSLVPPWSPRARFVT